MEYKKLRLDIDYAALGLDSKTEAPYLECFIPNRELLDEIKLTDRKNPAMLVIPGGGYKSTSLREHEPIAFQFLAAGFSVFILRYSCAPAVFPTSLFEVYTAIATIRKNAEEWLVDTNKISLCGFSAGGHLSASAGALWNKDFVLKAFNFTTEHKPNALVLSYPVITAGEFAHKASFVNLLGKEPNEQEIKYFSLENQVTAEFPPTFLWHTTNDDVVPVMNSILLSQALSKNNILFEMHIYPKGPHGLALSNEITDTYKQKYNVVKPQSWVKESIDFLLKEVYIN